MADIVVGYDGSACAKAALRSAAEMASALGDRVVVAFAFEDPIVGGESADLRATLTEMGRARVAEARSVLSGQGVESDEVVIEKPPAHALADLATERDARLIVVGTRGESPIKGALLGSTPHQLLHLSDKPVLVVPA